jgi:prepilin-type N-terminal cleavage/methylation domain-containing protein
MKPGIPHHKIGAQHYGVTGFTLIELLVVVAVLSAASLMAFGAFTEDRIQIRYDETRTRLSVLRRSVLGLFAPSTVAVASGFIADNGDLPSDLATLMQKGTLLAQGVQTPVFDTQPDAPSCANNGGEYTNPFGATPDANALLVKGHRGDYLGGMAFNGHFRDGWGNVDPTPSVDTLNSGWNVSNSAGTLSITSLGTDNATGGTEFAADIKQTITPTDWLIPLQGWTVTVSNISGSDINITKKLSVSLLVFHNTSSGGEWRRYSAPIVSTVCLDGNGNGTVDHDGDLGVTTPEITCPTKLSFSFAANCKAGDGSSGPTSIPQGRHLLLVTSHAGSTLWDGSDSPFWTPGKQALLRIDAVAGMPLTEAQLVLR